MTTMHHGDNKSLPFPTPLVEKHRPRRIEDFVGLVKPKRILEAFVKKPFDSAWFFLGPSGVGKTTLAMALGEQINAYVYQIASRTCDLEAVEHVAHICSLIPFNFTTGKPCNHNLVIVNEAEQMTPSAQNFFLSKLDATAPPPRTIFIFTANSTQGLDERFLSRCRQLDFSADSLEGELEEYLSNIYKREGGKYPINFCDIAKAAKFNVRTAINSLETELLIGTNRKGLPSGDLKILPVHTHFCKGNCKKIWKHPDPACDLPYRSVCPECGGAKTIGTERARKAWITIKKNAVKEHLEKEQKSKKKVKGA